MQLLVRLTADPGVINSIPAQSHTWVEIDHAIINFFGHSPPSADSRRVVVSYKLKYVQEVPRRVQQCER